MPDAPSFVHFSWLDDDPPPAAVHPRRMLAGVLSSLRRRLILAYSRGRDSRWI
jgi:hypothetical protein